MSNTKDHRRAILFALDRYDRMRQRHADGDRSASFVRVARAELVEAIESAFLAPPEVAPTPAQPSEDARDAARYRNLRAQCWWKSELFVVAGGKDAVRLGVDCPNLERLDAAVDALPTEPEGESA